MNGSDWSFKFLKNNPLDFGHLEIKYIGTETPPEFITFRNNVSGDKTRSINIKNLKVIDNTYTYSLLQNDYDGFSKIFGGHDVAVYLTDGEKSIESLFSEVGSFSNHYFIMDQEQRLNIEKGLKGERQNGKTASFKHKGYPIKRQMSGTSSGIENFPYRDSNQFRVMNEMVEAARRNFAMVNDPSLLKFANETAEAARRNFAMMNDPSLLKFANEAAEAAKIGLSMLNESNQLRLTGDMVELAKKDFDMAYDPTELKIANEIAETAKRNFTEFFNSSLTDCNKLLSEVMLPVDSIKLIRETIPSIMKFEEGNKRLLKDSYLEIPKESKISITLNPSKQKLIPMVQVENGIEYSLSLQPIVNSIPKIFNDISNAQAVTFISFLENYPFLAFKDPIGEKIFSELKKMASDSCSIIPRETQFYRCRGWDVDSDFPFTEEEMFGPYREVAIANRFNSFGICHLYLASSVDVARAEIGRKQKFNLMSCKNRNPLTLLDMSSTTNIVFEYCLKEKRDLAHFPKQYLLSNFVSQCCSYINRYEDIRIDGIRYSSTKNSEEFSYVLFNRSKDLFKEIKHSFFIS